MEIKEFVSKFRNHPVLFVGTGISLRYLDNSYTWDDLLSKICEDIYGNKEKYMDIKASCADMNFSGRYDFPKIGSIVESDFDKKLQAERNGNFKEINDLYYKNMKIGDNTSRFKLYLSQIFISYSIRTDKEAELEKFKSISKNISSIITTNYDSLLEDQLGFKPLIGNDILLSQPYGSIYKIHGCIKNPFQIVITKEDYQKFDEKYDLIRAQLLSLFMHNPVIFLGYKINDSNIKDLLRTIFYFVEPNSEQAIKIQNNFLLVEYDQGSSNTIVNKYDVQLDGGAIARINILKTDNFGALYDELSDLTPHVSAMDVRKVQTIMRKIYEEKTNDPNEKPIKVMISVSLNDLENGDYILAIASPESAESIEQIIYKDREIIREKEVISNVSTGDIIKNYFDYVEGNTSVVIKWLRVGSSEYFPAYGFYLSGVQLDGIDNLKKQQEKKIAELTTRVRVFSNGKNISHKTIGSLVSDKNIPASSKILALLLNVLDGNIGLDDLKIYLIKNKSNIKTSYRQLLCVYDYLKYRNSEVAVDILMNKQATPPK